VQVEEGEQLSLRTSVTVEVVHSVCVCGLYLLAGRVRLICKPA